MQNAANVSANVYYVLNLRKCVPMFQFMCFMWLLYSTLSHLAARLLLFYCVVRCVWSVYECLRVSKPTPQDLFVIAVLICRFVLCVCVYACALLFESWF